MDRLNDDRSWLSDSHITLGLRYVPLQLLVSLSELNRHWFEHYSSQNIWGKLKIVVLDTSFWTLNSKEPERYREGYRKKLNIMEYDFVVMPMHVGG